MRKIKFALCLMAAASLVFTDCGEKSGNDNSILALLGNLPGAGLKAGKKVTLAAGGISFVMAYMPGGKTVPGQENDMVTRTAANACWVSETEVTWQLWKTVYDWATEGAGTATGEGEYVFANPGRMGSKLSDASMTNQHPVTMINWRDAIVWCNALTEWYNAQTGSAYTCTYFTDGNYTTPLRTSTNDTTDINDDSVLDNSLIAGSEDCPYIMAATTDNTDIALCTSTGFRIPTLDEHEVASRYIQDIDDDGDMTHDGEYYPGKYVSGADAVHGATTGGVDIDGDGDVQYSEDVAVFSVSTTAAVKSKSPNALGLYDMGGNVYEFAHELAVGWTGNGRYMRSGPYAFTAYYSQAGSSGAQYSYQVDANQGIRLVRTVY